MIPFGLKCGIVVPHSIWITVIMFDKYIHTYRSVIGMAFCTAHFTADGQCCDCFCQCLPVFVFGDYFDEGIFVFTARIIYGNRRYSFCNIKIVGCVVIHGMRGGVLCFLPCKSYIVLKCYPREEFVRILPKIAFVATACIDTAVTFGKCFIGEGNRFIDNPWGWSFDNQLCFECIVRWEE